MNKFFEDSYKQIEEGLYEAIGYSKENFNDNIFISILVENYYMFQSNLIKLINNEISMGQANFYFNDIIQIYDSSKIEPPSKLYFKINSRHDIGMGWSTISTSNISSISPKNFQHIHIYTDEKKLEKDIEIKIKKYFFNKLKNLNNKYSKEINKINPFLVSLHIILKEMNSIRFEQHNLFSHNKFYSTSFIYETLEKNNYIKDLFLLSGDFDVVPHLQLMQKYQKSKKNDIIFK